MKTFFRGAKILMVLAVILIIFSRCSSTKKTGSGNSNLSAASIKNMIDSHKFVFAAESVNPTRGRYRNLTSPYDVSISNDSLVSYLPYFGRAYTAPLNPYGDGGINFTSTNFSYGVTHSKDNKWDVVIKPKDVQEVQQLNFSIFDDGSASLIVTNTSRDPISFNGRLK